MKLTAILLLTFLCLCLRVYSQSSLPHITLSLKNVPLKTALDSIEKKTGYTHFGESIRINQAKRVSIAVRDVPLNVALDICFRDQALGYTFIANTISITTKAQQDISVGGKLINGRREPVAGATIQVRGTNTFVQSNEDGEFSLPIQGLDATLTIQSINYERKELTIPAGRDTVVQLQERVIALNGVFVLHTGYQNIPKERATGSFTFVDNNLVNRNPSPNILQRLDGVTSSMIFTKNEVFGTNQSSFSIRGRSTILANPEPLIVVDNFPYTGEINNINPDDIDNVTVLKDAAAASIWGDLSGNGVLVFTTKKGKFNQEPRVCFNTSLTTGWKPDLYYNPILAPSEMVDVQRNLYNMGYYDPLVIDQSHPVIPPVAEILSQVPGGGLTQAQADNELNQLKTQDTRRDLDKYFYRRELIQQYSINLSGGGASNIYYFSAGYDKDLSSLVRNTYDRITLTGKSTYILIPQKLEFNSGFNYAASRTFNNNGRYTPVNYYVPLADAKGNAQSVPYLYRQSFIDTAGGGQLLDWQYRPLDELRNSDNETKLSDYRINLGLKYNISTGLSANLYYQFWKAASDMQNYRSLQTYFTRDLINTYTQVNGNTLSYPIPKGGMLDETDSSYQANNGRIQLDYEHFFSPDRSITAIAGVEVRDIEGTIKTTRLYGYNKDLTSGMQINNLTPYPLYLTPYIQQQIPQTDSDVSTSDRYLSYYVNASYHLFGKYIFSASARKDESNIFGVKTNQKGVPLWSAGADWEISREDFYHADRWLPYLKLRLTDGYNGNVDKSVSAFTTVQANLYNTYGVPTGTIINPPNPYLQWEKIHILNAGLEFATIKNILEGNVEYFVKYGENLIGPTLLDPTTGVSGFTGNAAAMTTNGFDVTLRTKREIGPVCWSATMLFSYVKDKVTKYEASLGSIQDYLNQTLFNPSVGRPLYSVYAVKWMGLDPQTGDPQGLLNGHLSKDYSSIATSTDIGNFLYMGPAMPTYYGSLRNTFNWKGYELSLNLTYKLGYVFRRPSINYYDLFSGALAGHRDFDNRWTKSGDERFTNVPSLVYPADRSRDFFYTNSEILVDKGDHIRFQDIRIAYNLKKQIASRLKAQSLQVYAYVSNLGILWRANHQGIDPDTLPQSNTTIVYPTPKTLTIGVKVGF